VERREDVRSLTSGRGVDVAIEATGNPAAVPEGLDLLRDGGTYVVAGHYTDAGGVKLNPHVDLNRKHVTLHGQWGTELHHLVRALRLLAKHGSRLPFAQVIGGRYGLSQADEALADLAALRVTKAIMEPRSGS
jgi:L-iditol 2-dehydrogenase